MAQYERVKLAVVGGHRGADFMAALQAFEDRITLSAICDISEKVLARWKQDRPDVQTFTSYQRLLGESDCTAVLIATPLFMHAEQAVQALEAGRHVVSEVVAAVTLEDCWRLVEAVEKTGRVYALAENYCYMRPNMMVLNLVEQGVFGELSYAEGAYIHDTRNLMFAEDGAVTWRGEMRRTMSGNSYPTHSLGPIALWLGTNRAGGDRFVSTATWVTPPRGARLYALDRFGPGHPSARAASSWQLGDSATTVIRSARGAVVVLRVDWVSPRPHNTTHYVLQGTRAAYLSARRKGEDPLIWIDGMSPGKSPGDAEWESLWAYSDRYEHPRWQCWAEQALQSGHSGGDFFILADFLDAVQKGERPAIDVYDAVTWSSIVPLSAESVAHGSAVVEIPDFTRGRGR